MVRRTLKHGQVLVLLVRNGDKFFGFLESGGERLLADNYILPVNVNIADTKNLNISKLTVLASLKCQLAQVKVRVRRGGDDHHVNRGVLDHLISSPEGLDTRVILLRVVIGLGTTLDDSVELQLGNLLDEGDVEDLRAEAVADNTDIVGFRGHGDRVN